MLRLIVLLFVSFVSFSQKYSLESAINESLKNRIELKNQKLLVEIAKGQNAKIAAIWKPQINGSVDLRWNTQLQTSVLPFDITGKNQGGSSEVRFGLPFNNVLGVQLDQKILDFNKKIDVNINNNTAVQYEIDLEKQKNNIKQSVSEAYFMVLINQELVKTYKESFNRAVAARESAETKFKVGTLLENDFNRFVLDENNAKVIIEKSLLDLDISLSTLKYQMAVPESSIVEVTDQLENLLTKTLDNYTQNESRPELLAEENAIKLNALNMEKELAKNKPSVSAYGNYSLLQLSKNPNPFASGTWFPFNFVGIKLNLPIFNGKQSALNIADYKLRQNISQNNIKKLKNDFDQEAQLSLKQMRQAKLDLEQTQKNIKLAESIYKIDKFKFDKGNLTLSELKASEFALKQSENNYLNAVYTILTADLRYKKATGNL